MNLDKLLIPPAFLIVPSNLFIILMLIIIFKNRYKIFTSNEFVLHFRSGKLKTASYGGGIFLLPIVVHIVVLSTAIQTVDISASDKVISKENRRSSSEDLSSGESLTLKWLLKRLVLQQ